ncbi:hypothetical protein SBA4_6540006 [Candidatus Sulfopaludibacter sp. SbA4]|nr:hypothetical protein SBA4_6540006 [Candidatus Sulfopaludibacter sp. SbA4]
MDIAFTPPTCACCEYRQLVAGSFDYLLPGAAVWTHGPHALRFGVPLTTAALNEDGVGFSAYGYRAFNGCTDDFVDGAGRINRAAGCFYQGHDFPSLNLPPGLLPPGTQLRIDLIFRGDAVDLQEM